MNIERQQQRTATYLRAFVGIGMAIAAIISLIVDPSNAHTVQFVGLGAIAGGAEATPA
jgi:hypothetical protein